MSGNNGGPWGGGGGNGGRDDRDRRPQRPQNGGEQPQIPEIDELMKRGQEQLRVLMGGRGGGNSTRPPSGGDGIPKGAFLVGGLVALGLWLNASFYTVKPEEQSVELFLGECNEPCIGNSGLNFAPWPLVTHEVIQITREQTIDIGEDPVPSELSESVAVLRQLEGDTGLMLTGDENIVDIDFQVVWNITRADNTCSILQSQKKRLLPLLNR